MIFPMCSCLPMLFRHNLWITFTISNGWFKLCLYYLYNFYIHKMLFLLYRMRVIRYPKAWKQMSLTTPSSLKKVWKCIEKLNITCQFIKWFTHTVSPFYSCKKFVGTCAQACDGGILPTACLELKLLITFCTH